MGLNMPKYEIVVKTDKGVPLFILTQFAELTAGRMDRSIMPLEIVMPQDDELYPVGTFKKDMIFELWREQNQTMVLDGETCYFLRDIKYYRDGSKDMIYLKAYDALYIIDGREVEYNAGSTQASKTGVACDVIKQIIYENFVDALDPLGAVLAYRNLSSSYFTIDDDDGFGETVTKAFSRQYVFSTIQALCNQSREAGTWITFDVVYSGSLPLVFKTYKDQRGNDITDQLLLSDEAGNIANPTLEFDWTNEFTVCYVAGKGVDDDRVVGKAANSDRLNESVWSMREFITENFQLELEASLEAEAIAYLDKYAPRIIFSGEIVETEGTQYGINWNYGDKVRAKYLGYEFDCRVLGYSIEYKSSGGKTTDKVTAIIRGETNV
jgi:hypothetical protein